jgi:hypothetical protein
MGSTTFAVAADGRARQAKKINPRESVIDSLVCPGSTA